jgi:hypothetical protein
MVKENKASITIREKTIGNIKTIYFKYDKSYQLGEKIISGNVEVPVNSSEEYIKQRIKQIINDKIAELSAHEKQYTLEVDLGEK